MSSPVEQIKSRLNIVDVVQSYVKLQKAGANFKALCPFHPEKTPSFFVSPARESWHCFGCNRGGDIFSFAMEIEGVEFYEALKILAARAGVELKPIDPKYRTERARLLELIEEAKIFFIAELKKNKDAVLYLKERGLKDETIKSFSIGFAPDGWKNLYEHLKNKKYTESEMERAGMVIKTQNYYDRFRSRIIFPIFNSAGQVAGFSGRIFSPTYDVGESTDIVSQEAKYINTPQTILYDKSRILYGFDRAKNEIRKKNNCILVEGQMDVIMSHQEGITNAVAVSGTSLTNEHLRIIKRLTDNLTMAFDQDEAGRGATGRGIDLALNEGFEIKIALISSGKDPAEVIKNNPLEWKKSLSQAKNIIEFYLEFFITPDNRPDRKNIERITLPYLAVLPSEMEKAHWVNEIAKRLNINEESVWEELKKTRIDSTVSREIEVAKKPMSRLELLKDRLIGFILWQGDTDDKEIKKITDDIIKKKGFDLDDLNIKSRAGELIFEAEIFYESTDSFKNELERLIRELEKEEIRTELIEITKKVKEFESSKEEVELKRYLNEFNKLAKKLSELK